MSFFTAGNLLTLGIVVLALVLYRQLDRNNRSLDKMRKYGDRLKEELSAFVLQKESAVKDYAVELDVHQKSAKELMKRVQLTDDELAAKAEAVSRIDERIGAYDTALEELVRMTARVQENLTRIREESAFVETVGKRVSEASGKMTSIEINLSDLELRFERENAEALERTSESLAAAVRSTVSDLQAAAETIERRVEDHREAVDKIERERSAALGRDIEIINKTLREAVERAGARADKMEDAALVKLRDQALERVQHMKSTIEEKLKSYQEEAKARVVDVQGMIKTYKEEWKNEYANLEAKQRTYKEEWKKDVQELNVLARTQREEWKRMISEGEAEARETLSALGTASKETRENLSAETGALEARLKNLDALTAHTAANLESLTANTTANLKALSAGASADLEALTAHTAADLEQRLADTAEEADRKLSEAADLRLAEWKQAAAETETRVRGMISTLEAASGETEKKLSAETESLEQRLRDLASHTDEAAADLERRLLQTTEAAGQKALETADARLAEYREAQVQQYQRLETLADDTSRLDAELRRYMQETENRVRQDFALFERESAGVRTAVSAEFTASLETLRADIAAVEQELGALKNKAYENVSEKLRVFEDDFSGDLARRGEEIDRRLAEWKEMLDTDLTVLREETEADRRKIELSFNEELRNHLSDQNERLVSELEHLKAETGAFEEGIRDQMAQADQSMEALKEQLDRSLDEARITAEASAKTEIGRYALSMAEALKQHQRELESRTRETADQVEARHDEITGAMESSRREIDEWRAKFAAQLREADAAVDEARRKTRELAAESDERIAAVRSSIEEIHEEATAHRTEIFSHTEEQSRSLDSAITDADRRLKEFITQTKLFDRAEELKLALEQRIEDLRGDMDRLDQRRSETAELEAQFVKIKRLEDEVNAKMTRFLSEKRRIELMEADFNRLLQTSQSVEEKLVQVSASDDTLQSVQVQIRKLEDAMTDAEEKYQRIERKNQTLETTNDGIDRNFKALQESEAAVKQVNDTLRLFSDEQENIRSSLEELAEKSGKAQAAAEKLSFLDENLSAIEERIGAMQTAREWLARTETRMEELNKEVQDQVRLMGTILKEEGGKEPRSRGAPPIGTRESVLKLHTQGWKVEEIARNLKLSRGEVELILEMGPKD
jgi:DNA repair exonuclease SbcCD ATPase subunit